RDASSLRVHAPDGECGYGPDQEHATSRCSSQAKRPAIAGRVVVGVDEGPPRRLRRGDSWALVSPVGRDSSGPGFGEQVPGARRELWVDEHELWADWPRLEKTSPRRSIDTTGEFSPERLDRCERGG